MLCRAGSAAAFVHLIAERDRSISDFDRPREYRIVQARQERVASAMGCHVRQIVARDRLLHAIEERRRPAIQEQRIGHGADHVQSKQVLQIDECVQRAVLKGHIVTTDSDLAVDLHLVPVVAHLRVRSGDGSDRMRAHLFGLVGEQRIELAIALIAAD